ncbi:MAG: hypothetical protein QRY71_04505 [Candidatus Rhabdochlamydia sp.]
MTHPFFAQVAATPSLEGSYQKAHSLAVALLIDQMKQIAEQMILDQEAN